MAKNRAQAEQDFIGQMVRRIYNLRARRATASRPENIAISILTVVVGQIDDAAERARVVALFEAEFSGAVDAFVADAARRKAAN